MYADLYLGAPPDDDSEAAIDEPVGLGDMVETVGSLLKPDSLDDG